MIVLPMAGQSSRFKSQGIFTPKYRLPIGSSNVLKEVLKGFRSVFNQETFVFITLESNEDEDFIRGQLKSLGVNEYRIISLKSGTRGQAETVYRGLCQLDLDSNEPLTVFNIDTFRKSFIPFSELNLSKDKHGAIEVFVGEGANWSNVISGEDSIVIRTSEKKQESKYCSTGLYYFLSKDQYLNAYLKYQSICKEELFIAPMYNVLINEGAIIRYFLVPPVKK